MDASTKGPTKSSCRGLSYRCRCLLCKFTLAILRQPNDKLSLKAHRWKCSLQPDYLKKVLGF